MSIPVELSELAATLAAYPWGYLVTVGDGLRAHSLAVPTDVRDGMLHATVGRSTRANIEARPGVTMVFPHPLGPTIATNSDRRPWRVTSLHASRAPVLVP